MTSAATSCSGWKWVDAGPGGRSLSSGAAPVASRLGPEATGAIGGLAEFVAEARLGDWSDEVRSKAKACLLYGLAVGAAGARTRLPRQVARMLDRTESAGGDGGDGSAHRLRDGRRMAPGAAAFANAVLLHARIQEDAHPAGHVGVVVLPAALAAAEHTGADGEALLAGIVAGYETALRIGRGHAAAASRRGFRTTPLYGVIGAAAAAARLHGLATERTVDALALAANLAGGLREFAVAGTDEYVLQGRERGPERPHRRVERRRRHARGADDPGRTRGVPARLRRRGRRRRFKPRRGARYVVRDDGGDRQEMAGLSVSSRSGTERHRAPCGRGGRDRDRDRRGRCRRWCGRRDGDCARGDRDRDRRSRLQPVARSMRRRLRPRPVEFG